MFVLISERDVIDEQVYQVHAKTYVLRNIKTRRRMVVDPEGRLHCLAKRYVEDGHGAIKRT